MKLRIILSIYRKSNIKHDFRQEFPGGPLVCDSWINIEIADVGSQIR